MRYLTVLIMGFAVAITAGCSSYLRSTTTQVPNEIKTITIKSYDPYGPLTRCVRAELLMNNIKIIDAANHNPLLSLHIIQSAESQVTTSLFQNGKTAEYQITLGVRAQVVTNGKYYYPIEVKVNSAFFNNPPIALAKDAEVNIIRQELCQQLAKQLVRKLLIVHTHESANN